MSRKFSISGDFKPPELHNDNRLPETHGQNLYEMSSFHFIVGINSKSFPWTVRSVPEHTPKRFAVDYQMQITASCDTFVITRRRHKLYKWGLLLGRLLRVD